MPTVIFYDGMPNVNEKLNELYANFAAGPYNALPLTGGNLTGPLTSTSSIQVAGSLTAGGWLVVGPTNNPDPVHRIYADLPEGGKILDLGRTQVGLAQTISVLASDGLAGWNSAPSVLYLGRNSVTGRALNTPGTLNASGADYAEYMVKRTDCGAVAPGQIVGIDGDGKITDRWNTAVSFVVKSTNPSMVGGDTWAAHLGQRPEGDQTEYDAALEAARQTVDRIAFAGQVPVNVQGAEPGDYVVPVADGAGIGALLVREDDLTLKQSLRAVGKVIAIEADGRARIIVKAV